MNSLSVEAYAILLGFYLFDEKRASKKSLILFTRKFNDYFSLNLNPQDVVYMMSSIRGFDPSYTAKPSEQSDEDLLFVWNHYVNDDRVNELKKVYGDFKAWNHKKIELIASTETEADDLLEEYVDSIPFTYVSDKPKPLYGGGYNSVIKPVRDISVSSNALHLANYKCEFCPEHKTFKRKNSEITYTEGHHLIPLKYQEQFSVNLDVEANVVSLCCTCHRKVHYGEEFEGIIRKLYFDRRKRLKACGIEINLDDLIKMYK